jgi:hypothetical protein
MSSTPFGEQPRPEQSSDSAPVLHIDVGQIIVQAERPIQPPTRPRPQLSYMTLSEFLAKREETLL